MGRTALVLTAFFLLAGSPGSAQVSGLPPIPEVPIMGWPLPGEADPFARALLAHISPGQLDAITTAHPEILPGVLRNLGTALLTRDPSLANALKPYLRALVRTHAAHLPENFSEEELQSVVTLQVVDPLRYGEDESFRSVVDTILPGSLDRSLPQPLRRAAINELNRVAPISFDTAEALAVAAGLVSRSSTSRQARLSGVKGSLPTSGMEPIEASIFSVNSRFASAGETLRFLTAVRTAAPARTIIVIGDDPLLAGHRAELSRLKVGVIDNFSRPFTLWPRDPFFVERTRQGQVVFVNRPNLQKGREEDTNMVRSLIAGLPPALDERWLRPRWTTGSTSFHNGHALLTPGSLWISIHSVEPRTLEILGRNEVPTDEFDSAQGIARYIAAARKAAGELALLAGRPVRFVHALPEDEALDKQVQLMTALGGGAGFDLDSIITMLPRSGGVLDALVADLTFGKSMASAAPAEDWSALRTTYSLTGDTTSVRDAVLGFQQSDVAQRLQLFLDRCAKDLAAKGAHVRRLPLLLVPTSLLASADDRIDNPYFLVGWNNVVLEQAASSRAEGFQSGFPSGDRLAAAAFKESGYQLTLFPTIPRGVILNGGYRCASNEVRRR